MLDIDKVQDWVQANKPDGWETLIWHRLAPISEAQGARYVRIDGPGGMVITVEDSEVGINVIDGVEAKEESAEFQAAEAFRKRILQAAPSLQKNPDPSA